MHLLALPSLLLVVPGLAASVMRRLDQSENGDQLCVQTNCNCKIGVVSSYTAVYPAPFPDSFAKRAKQYEVVGRVFADASSAYSRLLVLEAGPPEKEDPQERTDAIDRYVSTMDKYRDVMRTYQADLQKEGDAIADDESFKIAEWSPPHFNVPPVPLLPTRSPEEETQLQAQLQKEDGEYRSCLGQNSCIIREGLCKGGVEETNYPPLG